QVLVFHQRAGSGDYLLHARQERLLERRSVGNGCVDRRDAHDGRVEIFERLFRDDRRQLAADSTRASRLVEEQRTAGLRDRRQDRLAVERRQGAEIDHFGLHAFHFQVLGGLERGVHHRAERQDRQVLAFALHRRLPDRDDVVLVRDVVLDAAVQELVLEVQHRVIVAYRRLEESLRVVGGRG